MINKNPEIGLTKSTIEGKEKPQKATSPFFFIEHVYNTPIVLLDRVLFLSTTHHKAWQGILNFLELIQVPGQDLEISSLAFLY